MRTRETRWTFCVEGARPEAPDFDDCDLDISIAKANAQAFMADLRRRGVPFGRAYLFEVTASFSLSRFGVIEE